MIVGAESLRAHSKEMLATLGYDVDTHDDPYAAMLDLCRRPLVYRVLVLSLQGMYRDELAIINSVRKRFPHVAIWLANTDGRQAALAECIRMGAEAVISEEGIHSMTDTLASPALPPTQFRPAPMQEDTPTKASDSAPQDLDVESNHSPITADPVLTADELKALLGDDIT